MEVFFRDGLEDYIMSGVHGLNGDILTKIR